MSASERNEHEKGELWVKFITYIQIFGNKKNTDEKAKLLDFISTSVDNLDNFFFWFLERSDVYESVVFPEAMVSILKRIIYYRNVPMFKRFVYEFSPIYLQYLVLSPDILSNKQTKELLNILFLSYPLTRDFLRQSSEVLNDFLSSVLNVKPLQLQQGYLEFIQNVLYLYPDLPLDMDRIPEDTRCPVFSEVDIGKRIQSYFIAPWNAVSLKESPPLGNYLSDSEGILTVDGDYSQSTPSTSVWYSLSSPVDRTITKFIHSSGGDVFTLRVKENRVLYWVCPECSTQNDQICNCKSCNAPPPELVKQNGTSPVYYLVPGLFLNNYYITQNDSAYFPVSYIRYATPVSNTNLLQQPFTKTTDSVFFLPPQYYVSCYFPMDYNYFNSLFSSLVLPTTAKGLFTVVYSECFSINYNAETSKMILVLNPNKVVSFKSISFAKNSIANKKTMSFEMEVDKDLLCNIHYSVLNPMKVVIQIVNEVVICKLREPINNLTTHLSQFIICNIPGGEEQSKVGVLGVVIYRAISESKWTEMPPNAIILSLLGNHFSEDHGVRYLSEERLYRCSLKIGANSNVYEPLCHFFEKADIINNKRNAFIVNEFCYYNDICVMNSYVDCMTSNNSISLGHGPRMGNMYWKYLFSPSSFNVSFTVDTQMKNDNYSVMWLTNETLPTHNYINMIMKTISSYLSENTFEEQFIPIPYSLSHSMVFIVIKRIDSSTMKVHYGYTLKGTTVADNHVFIGTGVKFPVENHLSMSVSMKSTSISLCWDNESLEYKCLDVFTQPNAHFLVGWSGNCTTLYSFSTNAGEACSSLYVIPDKAIHLNSLHLLVQSAPVTEYPCTVRYRDKPALGSTDAALSHPKTYEGEGHVYSLDSSFKHYVLFASDKSKKDCIYCMFNNENEQNTMVSIYSALVATERRISRASDCVVSCFGNNRIQRYGKNSSGIANSNNTCFQNSTLQLLFHSDLLKKSIFEFYNVFKTSKCDLTTLDAQCLKELVLLLTRLQLTIRGYEVNNLVELLEKRFEIGYQHDMNEYFDYLLNAVDNCYNQMKKMVGDKLTVSNPLSLITGKQKEMICCQCGKAKTPLEDKKETEFQNSYISLTSPIAPITSISFQLFAYDAIPSTPYTTYIFVFEYKAKGVFLALERNPKKDPISNLLMKDKSGLPSNSVRIPSFHSYVSSQLYYQPFSPCYNHSTELDEENTMIPITCNQLVVDVLIRVVTSNSGEISQTNNGVFELIGEFEYGDQEYEIYQKVISCSSAEGMDMKGTIEWNHKVDLSKALPTKCESVLPSLSSILTPANFSVKEKNGYILFSHQIDLGVSSKENHVLISDKDNTMKMALYANRSLVGLASLSSNMLPCRVGACELIIGDTSKAKGCCYFSSSTLYLFDETYFDQFEFKIVAEEPSLISAIEYEGEWYSFAGCDDGVEYLFISEKSNALTLLITELYDNGQMRPLSYTHNSVNNTTPFEGTCITYDNNMYLCIPHSSSFAGCYYSLNQEDPYIPIEQHGTSFWYQKKKLVTSNAFCYIYSGYSLSYRLYVPQVHEMSISSMIQLSLNIQDGESEKQCASCNTPICKRHFITSFPDYLPISISRTFFDTSNYSLTKDCSHIFINPSISLLQEMYDLFAIVIHVGYSFDSGHYVVYCRHSDDEKNTSGENTLNTWNLFNDDTVFPCEWSEVLSQVYDYGTCPYYVVYRRRCTIPKAHPSLFAPSYLRNIPSLLQFDNEFVKIAEENNDALLREVPNAPFLLRTLHAQK